MLILTILPCACGSSGSGSTVLRATVPIGINKASTIAFSADGKTVAVTGHNNWTIGS
jgi:hypothetical protein